MTKPFFPVTYCWIVLQWFCLPTTRFPCWCYLYYHVADEARCLSYISNEWYVSNIFIAFIFGEFFIAFEPKLFTTLRFDTSFRYSFSPFWWWILFLLFLYCCFPLAYVPFLFPAGKFRTQVVCFLVRSNNNRFWLMIFLKLIMLCFRYICYVSSYSRSLVLTLADSCSIGAVAS